MQVGIQPKLDKLDAERLRDMAASAPFRLYRQRLEKELERQREKCERSDNPVELHRAQGAVAALRTALDLPDKLIVEANKP